VIVEGAAGPGKTSMLGVALVAGGITPVAVTNPRDTAAGAQQEMRYMTGVARVVAPTLRAAQVAKAELGIPAASVAALVYANGWRWNNDGAWTRLAVGAVDPETGKTFTGPPAVVTAKRAAAEALAVAQRQAAEAALRLALANCWPCAGATHTSQTMVGRQR
jgi:hypothetical protein